MFSSCPPESERLATALNIVIEELQMVLLTSTVINSNRNMKELERKIKCEKLMFR